MRLLFHRKGIVKSVFLTWTTRKTSAAVEKKCAYHTVSQLRSAVSVSFACEGRDVSNS
jgi:hypothetical protein